MTVARRIAVILIGVARVVLGGVRRRYRRRRAAGVIRRAGPGGVVVYHEGHWCSAEVHPTLRQVDMMEANAALLIGLLEGAGIPYATVPVTSVHRIRIAVPASEKSRVMTMLAQSPDPRLHLRFGTEVPWFGIPALRRPPRRLVTGPAEVRVYHAFADAGGTAVFDGGIGCSLEFWRRGPGGLLVSTLGDTRVSTASKGDFGSVEMDLATIRVRTLPVVARSVLFTDQQFPIDLVYTWVDGDDPAWRIRKAEVVARLDPEALPPDADAPERFRTRDELRFSLRSVSQFADCVRHVFLVTDRQVPAWLDRSCPRLTVIDHRDIFPDPATMLPTFNSHAIESRLHHIDGLSEHFVYMNDDFLFGRRVQAATFFHPNGVAKFFMSHAVLSGEDLSVDHAAANGADLLEAEFGVRITNKMKHAPYPLRRSTLIEMEERFSEAFDRTARAQLRSPSDLAVASSMGHYFGSFVGKSVPAAITNAYVDLGAADLDEQLALIALSRRYDVICLNDTPAPGIDEAARDRTVREWLERYYPVAGEFETA